MGSLIDRAMMVLHPILQSFSKMSGMYFSLIMGGNEPRDQGRTNVMRYVPIVDSHSVSDAEISMHFGETSEAVPTTFASDPVFYPAWEKCFSAWCSKQSSMLFHYLPSYLK